MRRWLLRVVLWLARRLAQPKSPSPLVDASAPAVPAVRALEAVARTQHPDYDALLEIAGIWSLVKRAPQGLVSLSEAHTIGAIMADPNPAEAAYREAYRRVFGETVEERA